MQNNQAIISQVLGVSLWNVKLREGSTAEVVSEANYIDWYVTVRLQRHCRAAMGAASTLDNDSIRSLFLVTLDKSFMSQSTYSKAIIW